MVGSAQTQPDPSPAPDQVLTTKVRIPRTRFGYLTRLRLLHALDEARTRKLTLVCTPAGFGKSTLLAEWAEGTTDLAVAWLSLGEDDNDPIRFWRYVLVALGRVIDLSEEVLSLTTDLGGALSGGLTAALIHEVEGLGEDTALVLDDYHMIESDKVHESVGFLLAHQPPRMHLVISTREDPPLPLARLRASDELVELRADDLRFDNEEADAFLRQVWGLDVAPGTVVRLQARTEGWAVGLQLAALSLQDRNDQESFIEGFTGTHRYVIDYLSDEVFESQPWPIREFMLRTSILERLSGPLCDAVTDGTGGQDMLEQLDRSNLFVIPLDEDRRWYRFHHLFADLLRARLHQVDPGSLPILHRRAAVWCAEHELIDEAIRHGLAAGEGKWAAELVEGHVEELALRRSERATLDRWLTLPGEVVATRPRLVLAKAIAAQIEGRLDASRRFLAELDEVSDHPAPDHEPSVGRAASVLANVPACTSVSRAELARLAGEPQLAAEFAQKALSLMTPDDRLLGTFARYHLSVADWMLGRLESAEQGLKDVIGERRAMGERYLAVRAAYDLGLVQQAQGRLTAALSTYEAAGEIMTDGGRRNRPETGLALVGTAEVMRQRGDLTEALATVTTAIEHCRNIVYSPPLAAGLTTLAWIHEAQGKADQALETADEARRAVPGSLVSVLDQAPTSWARLALLQGRVEEVAQWSEDRGLHDVDQLSYPREPEYVVFSALLLRLGQPARASELLQRLDDLASAQARYGGLLQIRALRAVALDAAGDHEAALELLADTLTRAAVERYVMVFVDEGAPMSRLLKGLSRQDDSGLDRGARFHLNRVLRAFASSTPGADDEPPAASQPPDPLTERELEILMLIASGKRNRDIADELWVSLDTVKKHVSHILDKLAVTNRTEAVAEARHLGLLGESE